MRPRARCARTALLDLNLSRSGVCHNRANGAMTIFVGQQRPHVCRKTRSVSQTAALKISIVQSISVTGTNGLNDLRLTMGERIATLIVIVFCMPLVFGGLVAVGESGDTRLLFYSALTLVLFSAALLRRRREFPQN